MRLAGTVACYLVGAAVLALFVPIVALARLVDREP